MPTKTALLSVLLPAGLVLGAAQATPRPDPVPRAPAHAPSQAAPAAVRLVIAPTGNEARYRIRERLVGMELPYDAVGKTPGVSGTIALDARGNVVPEESKLVIDVTQLQSDKERRDGYVQRRLLETEKYPTVEFAPTAVRGLGALPQSGEKSFQLVGNLHVKGVERPTVWNVRALFEGSRVTGSAATTFTFSDIQLQQPRVPVILSLADTIRLEYDFVAERK